YRLHLRLAVLDLVLAVLVADAGEPDARLPEERRQALEVGLFPLRERVVVALGTVEANAEEGARDAAGQADWVGLVCLVILDRDADEVRVRLVRPQTLARDQVADNLVVRAVGGHLLGQPGDEPTAAEKNERPILRADARPGEPLREVVGESGGLEEVL